MPHKNEINLELRLRKENGIGFLAIGDVIYKIDIRTFKWLEQLKTKKIKDYNTPEKLLKKLNEDDNFTLEKIWNVFFYGIKRVGK